MYKRQDIVESVKFAKQQGVKKIIIIGAEDALRVAEFLKENGVAVVLGETHRLPTRQDEPVYQPYRWSAPVSYTHLDVYKRQHYLSLVRAV